MSARASFRAAAPVACTTLLILTAAAGCASNSSDDESELPSPASYPHKANHLLLSVQPEKVENPKDPSYYDTHSFWLYGNRRVIIIGPTDTENTKKQQETNKYTAFPIIKTNFLPHNEMENFARHVASMRITKSKSLNFGTSKFPAGPEDNHPTETVTLNAEGVSRTATYTEGVSSLGLTEKQAQLRNHISAIQLNMNETIKDQVGTAKNYRPKRYAFVVQQSDQGSSGAEVRDWPGKDIEEAAVEWAGTKDDDTRCVMLPRGKTRNVLASMREAGDEQPLWTSGDTTYEVRPHPLLPDARDCTTAHAYLVNQ